MKASETLEKLFPVPRRPWSPLGLSDTDLTRLATVIEDVKKLEAIAEIVLIAFRSLSRQLKDIDK